MPDQIAEAIAALRFEITTYPLAVQIWMRLMSISFLSGLAVAWWDRRALWIVAMAVVTALSIVALKITYPGLTRALIGAGVHVVVWPLAAYALWRGGAAGPAVFRYWRYWVSVLIAISLVLDIRALTGWF